VKKFYIVISCILFSRIIAAQPNISVSPASFNVTIANCNDSVTQTLTINNTGNATLNYTLSQDNIPLGIPYHYGYICNAGSNTVSVINLKTNTLVGSPIAVGTFPWRVTISPDARFAYVSNRNSNNISVIRTSDNTVVATIAVGGQTSGIAVTPDSRYAYVGDRSYSDVKKIDCITNQVIDTIFSFDLSDPQDIAITPDGTKAYVLL
jgi:large repetitive protein